MSVIGAMVAGFRRALGSPVILLWLWLVNFAVAVPATWYVTESLKRGIGPSRVHETLRDGFDVEWHDEYMDEARGLGKTFKPTVTGAGPFYENLEDWLSGGLLEAVIYPVND